MRRSTFITWDQLKVGVVILVAIAALAVSVYRLGRAANLFADRYELVAFMPNANGLREGGTVMVAGQIAGTVKEISFLPVDFDTTANVRLVLAIDESLMPQIRENSTARLRTMGLLGDKVVDISPGTPAAPILPPGDTIPTAPSLDYEAVLARAADAVDDLVLLTADLREITGGIVRGEGTIGQLVTNRALYDEFTTTLGRTNIVLERLVRGNGTVAQLLNDPTLYRALVTTLVSLDSTLELMTSSRGTVGQLLTDTTLYDNLVDITTTLDRMLEELNRGEGTVGKLLNDEELYENLLKLTTDLNALLGDVRRDPRRYLRGVVKVF